MKTINHIKITHWSFQSTLQKASRLNLTSKSKEADKQGSVSLHTGHIGGAGIKTCEVVFVVRSIVHTKSPVNI